MQIYIRGYFSANFGDDLFVRVLTNRYPDQQFVLVLNSEYKNSLNDIKNLKVIALNKVQRGLSKFRILKDAYKSAEKKSDLSILVGGSLFQEYKNDRAAIERIDSYPGQYNPAYVIGSNFGPYHTQEFYDKCEKYFLSVKDVCFRDYYSYDLFQQLPTVRQAKDILFDVPNIFPVKVSKERIAVISVMDFENYPHLMQYEKDYLHFIQVSMENLIKDNYKIYLVSFCQNDGDEKGIDKVLKNPNLSDLSNISTFKYRGENWEELLDLFARAEIVIATRFHSMILGLSYKAKTLPILYNQKCLRVLEDLGYENQGIKVEDLASAEFNSLEYIEMEHLENVQQEAELQFKKLDEVLES